MPMPRLLISLGANLGSTYETMLAASRMILEAFGRDRTRFSRLYSTPPVGGPSGQSDFLNAVASIDTELTCWEVWDVIKRMERELGRQRQQRWEARRIDVDILIHGDSRVWTPHLKIPHPRMCMRSFVLVPAMDIAADAIEPVTGWTIARLHDNLLQAPSQSTLVLANTEAMRDELQQLFDDRESHVDGPALRFLACPTPETLGKLGIDVFDRFGLSIFCVRTPDPETIQWEDYAFPWARSLGLTDALADISLHGPRYLLPANDLSWTVHEIRASRGAMTCPVHLVDRPFGDISCE
jgi:2-amino-4-hydroxy-6-hydroxymethyldihydropteridine diphosphokinase